MVLYFELAANGVAVWIGFVYGHPAMSVAGRVALVVGDAFAPLLAALLVAWLLTKELTTRNAPPNDP